MNADNPESFDEKRLYAIRMSVLVYAKSLEQEGYHATENPDFLPSKAELQKFINKFPEEERENVVYELENTLGFDYDKIE